MIKQFGWPIRLTILIICVFSTASVANARPVFAFCKATDSLKIAGPIPLDSEVRVDPQYGGGIDPKLDAAWDKYAHDGPHSLCSLYLTKEEVIEHMSRQMYNGFQIVQWRLGSDLPGPATSAIVNKRTVVVDNSYAECAKSPKYARTSSFCVAGWNLHRWRGPNPNSPSLVNGRGKSIQ